MLLFRYRKQIYNAAVPLFYWSLCTFLDGLLILDQLFTLKMYKTFLSLRVNRMETCHSGAVSFHIWQQNGNKNAVRKRRENNLGFWMENYLRMWTRKWALKDLDRTEGNRLQDLEHWRSQIMEIALTNPWTCSTYFLARRIPWRCPYYEGIALSRTVTSAQLERMYVPC